METRVPRPALLLLKALSVAAREQIVGWQMQLTQPMYRFQLSRIDRRLDALQRLSSLESYFTVEGQNAALEFDGLAIARAITEHRLHRANRAICRR
jgi:hypothetical protein